MADPSRSCIVHVGWPKTATTTLQRHVFPNVPGLHYLGKRIPGYGYTGTELAAAMADLLTAPSSRWSPAAFRTAVLAQGVADERLLVSSENFIHPASNEPAMCARRLHEALPEARILIGIREQVGLLTSFYRNHGAFGSYLFLNKPEARPFSLPLTLSEWLELNLSAPHRNLLGLLDFDAVIKVYEDLFGPDRVTVIPFEAVQHASAQFTQPMSRLLGLTQAELTVLIRGRHENPGLTPAGFRQITSHVSGLNAAPAPDIYTGSYAGEAAMDVAWSEDERSRIRHRFAESNAALSDRRRLRLDQLGYAVAPTRDTPELLA